MCVPHRVLVACIVSLVAAACTESAPPVDTTDPGGSSQSRINHERLSRIPARMQQFVDDGMMAGAVMLIAVDGEVVLHEAVGYQDLDTRTPMSVETIFQVQSMTKPVSATAAMILVEDGLLRLTDPVARYLPEFRTREPLTRITVHHLLTHSSGLPHGHLSDQDPPNSTTLAAVVADNATQTLLFEPGQSQLYSNLGLETLGRVIEVVSGKPYEEFLKERIFDPLEMEDSFFRTPSDKSDRVATIYQFDESGPLRIDVDPTRPFAYMHPGAGLLSTARDLFAFYQMTLNGGVFGGRRVLSPAGVKTMTALHIKLPPSARTTGRGMVWWVVAEPMGVKDLPMQTKGTYGHAGYWGTLGWVDPTTGLVGVFLTHSFDPSDRRDIAQRFVAMAAAALEN